MTKRPSMRRMWGPLAVMAVVGLGGAGCSSTGAVEGEDATADGHAGQTARSSGHGESTQRQGRSSEHDDESTGRESSSKDEESSSSRTEGGSSAHSSKKEGGSSSSHRASSEKDAGDSDGGERKHDGGTKPHDAGGDGTRMMGHDGGGGHDATTHDAHAGHDAVARDTGANPGTDGGFDSALPDSGADAPIDSGPQCGPGFAVKCPNGDPCTTPTDCVSNYCSGNVCANPPPACNDGMMDDGKTGFDCGGPNCPACGTGQGCLVPTDCTSLVCTGDVCQAPTDSDGVENDSETATDCGGGFLKSGSANPNSDGAPACGTGLGCLLGTDCQSLVCYTTAITPATASKHGSPINCPTGATCTCQPPSPDDGVQNDSETGIDCGGSDSPTSDGAGPCGTGVGCQFGSDCAQGVCNDNGNTGGGPIDCPGLTTCVCQPPWPNDGVQNDSETDVDCGGSLSAGSDGAPPCAPGLMCYLNIDCQSALCQCPAGGCGAPGSGVTGICTAPTDTDGIQNDSETGVDCGGGFLADGTVNPSSDGAPPCADDVTCVLGTDCLSGYCSAISFTCVDGQSCVGLMPTAQIMDPTGEVDGNGDAIGTPDPNGVGQNAGIDTCGAGESTDPPASQAHESCCRSLLLPDSSARLDKYEVTAGRMRQFVESVNYDVYDWANAQIAANTPAGQALAAQIPPALLALLPTTADTGTPMNVVVQLGGTTIDPASIEQGCYVGNDAGGASVFWWPATTLTGVGSPPRPFTQDYYDIKSQNCGLYQMYAAFCAWDGGELATPDQVLLAYGTNTYPWGASPMPNPAFAAGGYPYQNMAGQMNPWCGGTVNPNVPNVSNINVLVAKSGLPATQITMNWLNSNNAGNEGCFYYYPSFISSNPNMLVPDSLSNGLDFSPQIAAPGRFVYDLTSNVSPSFAGNEGWYDLGANMIEEEAVSTFSGGSELCDCTCGGPCAGGVNDANLPACTCELPGSTTTPPATEPGVLRASGLPASYLEGGSWEGHSTFDPSSAAFWPENWGQAWGTGNQYGKIGARCSRPVEPAP